MESIDLKELKSFVVVAEVGSFTEAAGTIGISQSALTRQIQSLEEKVGRQLLSRTTRITRLTPEGEFWLEKSRQILGQVEAAGIAFAGQFTRAAPTVRVGVCSTISQSYLPGFFHSFRRHFPDNQIRLNQGNETKLIQQLDQCHIDIAIVTAPKSQPPGIEITHSFEDRFVLIGPESDPEINPDALGDLPLISIDRQTATGALLENWLVKQRIDPTAQMEFDNFDLIISSVSLGLGGAIVPRRSLAIHRDRKLRSYTLQKPPSRTLSSLARAENNRPAIIQAFIDHILF